MTTVYRFLIVACFCAGLSAHGATSQLNVMSFGARGNGQDNDTAAVQAGMNAASRQGIHLLFPSEKVFKVSSLLVTNDLSMELEGNAKIVQDASLPTALLRICGTNKATIKINGGIIDGNKFGRSAYYHDTVDNGSIIDSTNGNKRLYFTGVTFTNLVRGGIRTAGFLVTDSCQFVAPHEHDGVNLQSLAYCIYAQPTGWAEDMTIRVVNSDFIATSWAREDLYKQAAGIFITEQSGGTNKFREVIVMGNRSKGIGGNRLLQPVSFLDTYNGAHRVIAMGNHNTHCAYGVYKMTRVDDAIVAFNTIEHVEAPGDGFENVCMAIVWEPLDREGGPIFSGSRTNENHFNFICQGNILRNATRTGLYIHGPNALVTGNILDGMAPSDRGDSLPLVLWDSDNSTVSYNQLNNMPANAIWIVGGTNINLSHNRVTPIVQDTANTLISLDGTSHTTIDHNTLVASGTTNRGAGIWLGRVSNILLSENTTINCKVGIDLHFATNIVSRGNISIGCPSPYAFDTNSPAFRQENNSWNPWGYRFDTNGLAYLSVQNLDTNSLANSLIEVITAGGGGYLASYPTNFINARMANRTILGANTAAAGVNVELGSTNQDFRIYTLGTNNVEVGPHRTKITGDWTQPLALDSFNAAATQIALMNSGSAVGYLGWQRSLNGLAFSDSSGSYNNLVLSDNGDVALRGLITGRRDTNGLMYMSLQNRDTNSLASVLYEVRTVDSGGYFSAYPSNFAAGHLASRAVIGANTGGAGLAFQLPEGDDDLRVNYGTTNLLEVGPHRTKVNGDWRDVFTLESTSALGTQISWRNNGNSVGYFGWLASLSGFAISDAAGANNNMIVEDDGDVTIRGTVTASSFSVDTVYANQINVASSVTSPGSITGTNFVVSGTTNQVIFGATNTAPANPTTPTKWISVQVQGESATYRMPLYE